MINKAHLKDQLEFQNEDFELELLQNQWVLFY